MSTVLTLGSGVRRAPGLELVKYWAFLLMLVDHVNAYLLGGAHEWMWQAGRLVFPAFALVLGFGLRNLSTDRRRLILRLLAIAVVAEVAALPLELAGVRPGYLNVCFTLTAGVVLVEAERSAGWYRVALAAIAVGLSWHAEYGFLGAALVWAAACRSWAWVVALVGVLSVWQGSPAPLAALPALLWAEREAQGMSLRSWRSAFGVGYVAQFLLFAALL